jgi:hypothetical protein
MERITTLVKDGASKSLMLLWQRVASEEAAQCHTSTLRDFNTVTRRVEEEGLSFLTITLSNLLRTSKKVLSKVMSVHQIS